MNRRQLFAAGLGAAGLGVVSTVSGGDGKMKPSVRAAHITDVHITDKFDAPNGVAAMLDHMFGQKDWSPDLILNSGDTVMAVDGRVTGKRAAEQIALWKAAVKGVKIPIHSCLGNHDVWDGNEPTDEVPVAKKGFALMTEALGMPAEYYNFEAGGWTFFALNSVCNWPKYGVLTADHLKWLKAELKKVKSTTPVCVFSHLPILSVTSSVYGDGQRKEDGVLVPKTWQHADCWEITEVFRRHPNVKLCLSGHMHTCDRVEYRGVWYVCGGAASGSWWAGSEYGFPPLYGAIDFYQDGAFEYRFVDYGWKARAWKGKELKD